MSEVNSISLFERQKKIKPLIEDAISALLDGVIKQTALEFVAYLRENKLSPLWTSVNSWKISYRGKGVCYIKLDQYGNNSWNINPLTDYSKEYEKFVTDENLRDIIWSNLALCRRCHPNTCAPKGNEDTFTGVKKTYFGKEFDNVCRGGDTSFFNPDQTAITCIKKMFDFKRQAIEGNQVPKVKYMSPKKRISNTEVITIEKEIKVVGLSLEKSVLPKKGESIGELWGIFSDAHRIKTKNVKIPIIEYGFWFNKPDSYDYIVGSEVEAFGENDDELIMFAIPAGRYIKDTFNAFDFEELVCDVLAKRLGIVKKWADENSIITADPSMFPVTGIEVYPVQDMAKPEGEVTNENFRRDGRIKSKYPLMYTLTPIG